MSSAANLAKLIQLGGDISAFKLYTVSATALLFYDYTLTFNDELRYGWKTDNVPMFVLFLLLRYLPVFYQTWVITTSMDMGFTSAMCERSAFLQILYYMSISALSQIVLTQRAYAITMKNKWVAGILYLIVAGQVGAGISKLALSPMHPGTVPPIRLESFHLCLTQSSKATTAVQMSLTLIFDIAILVLILMQTMKWTHRGMRGVTLLSAVSKDARIYFAVITTSYFVIVVMYFSARPRIRSIAIVGNIVFIPMLVCRMIMSLRKFATTQTSPISIDLPTGPSADLPDASSAHAVDGIKLSEIKERQAQHPVSRSHPGEGSALTGPSGLERETPKAGSQALV